MQCKKPRFVSIKKEVEKKLLAMEFQCKNINLGCLMTLGYNEVQIHDTFCDYQPIKC